MRFLSILTCLIILIAVANPAIAKNSKKFNSNIALDGSTINIEVVLSEDLIWRGKNLPKDRRERGSIRNFNNGFSGNGYYGTRDLERLAARLEKRMKTRLNKANIGISGDASQTLRITLTDARPTRPTFTQMSKKPSLSYQSYGLGGAAFEGKLVNSSGQTDGHLSYAWYETNISFANTGSTWSDAHRAIDRFARQTVRALHEKSSKSFE